MPTTTTQLPLPIPKYFFHGEVHFNYNWNKKFYCKFFTTIRLQNESKYKQGKVYKIFKNKEYILDARIEQIRSCKLQDLPDYTCYLDTGYNKQQTIDLIKKMYSNKNINWQTQLVSVILLEHLDWDKP